MKLVPIKDIFNLEKGTLQSSKALAGKYAFITAASEWKTNEIYTHDTEALIFAAAASGSLGRTHYVNGKFITSDLCFILTPKNPKQYPVNLQYYYQLFNSLRKEIVAQTKKGTSKDAISKQRLEEYCIPYLDIAKQNQLAIKGKQLAIMKKAFETEVIKQQKLIIDLKQSILQDAVQGELVPQDPNDEPASVLLEKIKAEKEKLIKEGMIKKGKVIDKIKPTDVPFGIPNSWEWCRLSILASIGTGATPLTSNLEFYNGEIPWITSALTNNDEITKAEQYITEKAINETNCKIYPSGTLIIAMYGQGKTRGQISQLKIAAATNQACAAIETFLNDDILKKYLFYFFKSQYNKIRLLAQGGAQPNLNMGKISNTLIPLPPLQEQKRIVEKVKILFQQIDKLSSENNNQQKLLEQINYSFVL